MSNEIRFGIATAPINFGIGINSNFFLDDQHEHRLQSFRSPLRFPAFSTLFQPIGASSRPEYLQIGELHDTFGWTKGSHQWSFGVDSTYIEENDFFGNNATVGLGIDTNNDPATAIFSSS